MVEWIFWDNDGVLVDTEALYFRANREILAQVGIDLTRERFIQISMREGRSTFDLALEHGVSADIVAHLHVLRNQRYSQLLDNSVLVMQGAPSTLSRLKGRLGMGVVTSSRKAHFDRIHEHSNLRPFFDFVITCEDVARTKPDPEPYLQALARTGCRPEECLVVEDSERGLTAAAAAGIPCVVVPNALTATGNFTAAQQVVGNIREILKIVMSAFDSPTP